MSDEVPICFCFGTTRADVREHFSDPSARVDALIEKTGITTRCTACALDLDVLLDEIRVGEQVRVPHARADQSAGGRWTVDRIRSDSGFFLNTDAVSTHVRLANYAPFFKGKGYCAAHRFVLTTFNNSGARLRRMKGMLDENREWTFDIAPLAKDCAQGWFLLEQIPLSAGFYGTMRPQAVLLGAGWTAAYHTQFHADATRSGRRAGSPLRSVGGATRAKVSLINAGTRVSRYEATLTGPEFRSTEKGAVPGNGALMLDIDESFKDLPLDAPLVLRIDSDQPTRKNLINCHPDGTLGVEHFPNLV